MNRIRKLLEPFDFGSSGKWIALSVLVGILAGVSAVIFNVLTQLIVRFSLAAYAGYSPPEAAGEHSLFEAPEVAFSPWMIVLVMAAGGLVSGFLVHKFAPEAEDCGTDGAIEGFHNQGGSIRFRVPLIKTLASAVTLGTGGSGGREGPIALIGAGLGSWIGQRLKLSARDRRILLAAGMGAGVGAMFRAPLAGAVFAGEILYSDADLESDAIVPAATASIVAYSVFTQSLPPETRFLPLFGSAQYSFSGPLQLIPYAVLAVALVLAGIFYVRVFHGTRRAFELLPVPPLLRPAIGAALAGLIGVLLFKTIDDERVLGVLGTGYGVLQQTLTSADQWAIGLLACVALFKVVTTSCTISSGGSGGVFGPSMVIGGCVGAAVGKWWHAVWPEMAVHPEAFAVVGMAGFFAGVARAPISTIIMVRALTGNFALLVPTMLVTSLTFLGSRNWRIYLKQVPTRLDSPAHRGDFIVDVLEGLKVGDVFDPSRDLIRVKEGATLDEIVHQLATTTQHYFPVINDDDRLVGIFSDDDVRSYLYNDTLWNFALADDVMITEIVTVTPDDDLNTALQRFTMLNLDELPVVSPDDNAQLLGMVRRKETIAAYNRRLMEHKMESEKEAEKG